MKQSHSLTGRRRGCAIAALCLTAATSALAVPAAEVGAVGPLLTVTPVTWNVIGLDSNTPATGPNRFPVGARVCNAVGADDALDVSVAFVWDSPNTYVDLRVGSLSSISLGVLSAGSCADAFFEVEVDKTAAAFDTTRRYHITATDSSSGVAATTPQPRELYVEHLISQNRNGVTSVKLNGAAVAPGGSMVLMVGETYTIELAGYTATQGYNQLEAFINFPNTIFQTLAVSTSFTADSSNYVTSPSDRMYADGCLWDNDPNSPNYRSCIGDDGKTGGTVVTTYTVKILSGAGSSETLSSLLYDFSGSSYHYNADFSLGARIVQIIGPSSVTISKAFVPRAIAPGGTSAMTFRISNPTPQTISGVNFADNLLGGLQVADPAAPTYEGCGGGAFAPAPSSGDTSLTFDAGTLAPHSVCTMTVNVTAPAGNFPNTTEHLFINGTTDTGNFGADTLVAASAPSCVAGVTLASWSVPDLTAVNPPDLAGGLPTTKATNVTTALASANVPLDTSIAGSSGQGDTTSWRTWGYKSDGQYIDFVVDTSKYSEVSMDFYVANPGGANGPNSLLLSYSTGGSFTTLPSNLLPGSTFELRTVDLSGLTSTSGNTTLRLTATGANNDQIGANLDYDNIRFSGCGVPSPAPTMSKAFVTDPIIKGASTPLTFTINNTAPASTALTGVAFTDVLPSGLSVSEDSFATCGGTVTTTAATGTVEFSGGSLAADASCTFDVAVVGDVAGRHDNVTGFLESSESGVTTSYGTDSLTVIAPPLLVKSFSPASILVDASSTLTFRITNPNQLTTLSGIDFTDSLPAGVSVASSGPSAACGGTLTTVAPDQIDLVGATLGANEQCSFDVVVVGTTAGPKLNTTSAITSLEGGSGSVATAELVVSSPVPAIDLNKQVSVDSVTWSKFTSVPASDQVFYRFAVYNGGDTTLTTIDVDDPMLSATPADPAGCAWSPPLVPGDTAYCITGPVSTLEGSHPNTATATGTHLAGTTTSSPSTATYATPGLTLVKTALEENFSAAGETLHYSYLVTNSGYTPLLGAVVVSDDKSSDETCPTVDTVGDLDDYLDPGESITCVATYLVESADVTAGSVTNIATATIAGLTSAVATATVPLHVETAALTLSKTADPTTYDEVGDVISYSFLVTNSGNTTLTGPFTIADDQATDEVCPTTMSLTPGSSLTCTASDTVEQADLDSGSITNVATATNGTVTSPTSTATVSATQSPALSVVKSSTEPPYTTVGRTLTFTIEATNTGNVTLSNVVITDEFASVDSCSLPEPVTLAPAATLVCTATHITTQADLDRGYFENVAGASATTPDDTTISAESNIVVIPDDQIPALTIAKSTNNTSFTSVGQQILYTIVATNTGNVTLGGVTISDPNASVGSCTPAAPASLAPGQSLSCPAVHTVTQADLQAASISNTATASGDLGVLAITGTSNTVILPLGNLLEIPRTGAEHQQVLLWSVCAFAAGWVLLGASRRRAPKPTRRA